MNAADLRTKTADELNEALLSARKEQLNLRFQKSTGQLENVAEMVRVRKNIAQIKTVMTEKRKGIEVVAAPAKAKKETAKKETKKADAKKPAAKKTAEKKAPAKKDKKA